MRDGGCLRCGDVDAGESGRALHVHHIVPEKTLRAAGEDPHDPTNLISVCGPCHRTLEGMAPESQLTECDIESPENLVLTREAAAWLETFHEKYKVLNVAPDPWPGMFAEAQRHLTDRD
ncbi:HNH endonuclease [Natrialbaceae archaeon A-CW3]